MIIFKRKRIKKPYYIDMDCVLADFLSVYNSVKVFRHQPKFFLNLKPILKNVKAVNNLIASGEEVYIISSSPNKRCDTDKILWLKKYVPGLRLDHIIIIRLGQKKVDYLRTEAGVLFDDYGKNCSEWVTNKKNIACRIDPKHGIDYYVRYISKHNITGGAVLRAEKI